MADLSQEQFERYMDEMRKSTAELSKVARSLSHADGKGGISDQNLPPPLRSRAAAARKKHDELAKKVNGRIEKTGEALSLLQGRSDALGHAFSRLAKGLVGGAILGQIINYSNHLVRSYRDVASVGQVFEGSVFKMAKQAGAAGLPLEEFADAIRKNSKVVSAFGAQKFMQIAKDSRDALMTYGFTMEQASEITGGYMEVQRRLGNTTVIENGKLSTSIKRLGLNTSALAGAFGTSRDEILRNTTEAMQDTQFMASLIGKSGPAVQAFTDRAMDAVSILSALPGEAGQLLSKNLAQAMGNGTALFGAATDDFIQSGLGSMVSATEALANATKNGADSTHASFMYMTEFKKQVEDNAESLKIQSAAGNTSATKMLQMYEDMRGIGTEEQFRKKQDEIKQTTDLTAVMLDFANMMKRLGGKVIEGLLGKFLGLDKSTGKFNKFLESKRFQDLEITAGQLGEALGGLFEKFANWVGEGDHAKDMAKDFGTFLDTATTTVKMFAGALRVVNDVIGAISKVFGKLYEKTGLLGVGLAIGGAMIAKWFLGGFLKNFLGSKFGYMAVKAGVVNVNGSGGGGGDLDLGDLDKDRHGRKTGKGRARGSARLARAGRLARAAEATRQTSGALHAVTDGAKMGKIGLRGLGFAAKKIPGVSIAAGLGLGGMRLMAGDKLGAGTEVLSGLASTIPILGTAASVLLDGALMARDITGRDKTDAMAATALKKVAGTMIVHDEEERKRREAEASGAQPTEKPKPVTIVAAPSAARPVVIPPPISGVPFGPPTAAAAPAAATYSPPRNKTEEDGFLLATRELVKSIQAVQEPVATTNDALSNLEIQHWQKENGLNEAQIVVLKQIYEQLRLLNQRIPISPPQTKAR